MVKPMKYSAHKLLTNQEDDAFLTAITLDDVDIEELKASREKVRQKIRQAFASLSLALFLDRNNQWIIDESYYSSDINESLRQLDAQKKLALKELKPKFNSQGSFVYETLNKPCHLPPQQMDLDDGVYLPIEFLRDEPIINKRFFFLIIDKALQELAKVEGWEFKEKETCARLEIPDDKHIDVPLYAIPKERHLAMAAKANVFESALLKNKSETRRYLDADEVYLAVRNGEHWVKSDPMQINNWFEGAVQDNGEILRRVCRYLKAWRDYKFEKGGPSSITLMACAVETLNNSKRFYDDSRALLHCVEMLHDQLKKGVDSPVDEKEPRLFPKNKQNPGEVQTILNLASELKAVMRNALLKSTTTKHTIDELISCFGVRMPDRPDLIEDAGHAAISLTPAIAQPRPRVKNTKAG